MRGYLLFSGLLVCAGLLAATLAYVDHRQKAQASALVDALNTIEEAIEVSHALDVEIYQPSIDSMSDPGRWTLSGILVTGNPVGGIEQAPFTAVLERHCESGHDSPCWSMKEFNVTGVGQSLSDLFGSDRGAARRKATVERLTEKLQQQMAHINDTRQRLAERYGQDPALRTQGIVNTISRTGLDANRLVSDLIQTSLASGGPLIAARDATARSGPNTAIPAPLPGLDAQWDRLFVLEDLLWRLPMAAPLKHYRISSTFGGRKDPMTGKWAYHSGLDLVGPLGSAVQATASGTVTFAGPRGRYGNMVAIDHGHGISTRYGHLREIFVEVGQRLETGQEIAIMGSSGRSTGPHLHYEIRSQYETLDPMKFLQAGAKAIGNDPELSIVNMQHQTGEPAAGALLLAD